MGSGEDFYVASAQPAVQTDERKSTSFRNGTPKTFVWPAVFVFYRGLSAIK
jgi:hypothetical protein